MSYLAILFLLSLLVMVHEAGHLAAARLAGIPVAEFAVGFGPKLWSRRWGRTAVFNLLPIPLLDGGQILLGCLERLFPRVARLREPLTVLGMVVLAAVMIYANVLDVVRIWG